MARKIMRSLWDISNEVSAEARSTKPVGMVDDYTYGNDAELRDNMIDGIPDAAGEDIIKDENHNGIPDDIEHEEPKALTEYAEDEMDPLGLTDEELLDMALDGDIVEIDIVEIEVDPEFSDDMDEMSTSNPDDQIDPDEVMRDCGCE